MGFLIFWLICAGIGVLALNYSMLKESHVKLEKLYKFAQENNMKELNEKIKKFKSFKWVVRPNAYLFSLILGPIMILILLIVYKKNFSIYYRPK